MTRPKLEWRKVGKRFGDATVLEGLNLRIEAGRSTVIIGGSGQGKSIMVKLALGLMAPDSGKVLLDGRALPGFGGRTQRRLLSRSGVLFQSAALFDSLSVWENVAFRLINADRMPREAARRRALDALSRVRLGAEVADVFPADLSGGMQKRVGLARAIAADPEILFFDEPTTGLDPITAAVINELIVDQVKRLGCTAVSITHDLASARRIGDQIAMLHGGAIVWQGAPGELDTTRHPDVRRFVDGG
ncbi:ABC transporter ATP-binding protein [Phenylobacterium sp.]|uniref:ABC transporter ATP-binding protein n=1 Tax=Phenylobacterium sp. TaxID=1871053 RepID=UPI00271F8E06|nr:ATP-binding cassette domain-containing protein [Phenylobacterium sp.]MDO8380370.1 ATP-binding cassette domain-containing protein [Phenylobacterium sp.]